MRLPQSGRPPSIGLRRNRGKPPIRLRTCARAGPVFRCPLSKKAIFCRCSGEPVPMKLHRQSPPGEVSKASHRNPRLRSSGRLDASEIAPLDICCNRKSARSDRRFTGSVPPARLIGTRARQAVVPLLALICGGKNVRWWVGNGHQMTKTLLAECIDLFRNRFCLNTACN